MPVLMIATYNDDGTVDVMNAAWGTMVEQDTVAICLSEEHKTVENILKRKAFTVSIATDKTVVAADYLGVVSGNKVKDKFEKSGLTADKSSAVDAPVIREFPVCLECELIKRDEETGFVFGKVVSSLADEEVIENGKVNVEALGAIAYDPYTHGYYKVGERVGNAFKDGLKLR